ncbi:sel1 repeat family protein [Pelomyxa schiedti]|nr:sel1 repeat family protein [Pelomyxa schiedti]
MYFVVLWMHICMRTNCVQLLLNELSKIPPCTLPTSPAGSTVQPMLTGVWKLLLAWYYRRSTPHSQCGVGKDTAKAFSLLEQAVECGNGEALLLLGTSYERGKGVRTDTTRAIALYQRAADAGIAEAFHHIANCYYFGRGVAKNVDKAAVLFQQAINAGHRASAYDLGICYRDGAGVVEDSKKAMELFYTAVMNEGCGSSEALAALGFCHLEGDGVSVVDVKTATKFLRLAAADKVTEAQEELDKIIHHARHH